MNNNLAPTSSTDLDCPPELSSSLNVAASDTNEQSTVTNRDDSSIATSFSTDAVESEDSQVVDTDATAEETVGSEEISELSGEELLAASPEDELEGDESSELNSEAFSFGIDSFTGATGTDTVVLAEATGGVSVELDTSLSRQAPGIPIETTSQQGEVASVEVLSGGASTVEAQPLVDIENVIGSRFSDAIFGSTEDNVIFAWQGDDDVFNVAGDNVIDGGEGDGDTIFYASAVSPVQVDLALQGLRQDTGIGSELLTGFENVVGSTLDDTIAGDDEGNELSGDSGNDSLNGSAGDDSLDGGEGDDTLVGGEGSDTFLFDQFAPETTTGNDVVEDFELGVDRLTFTGLFDSVESASEAASQVDSDTLFDLGDRGSIRLKNIDSSELLNPETVEETVSVNQPAPNPFDTEPSFENLTEAEQLVGTEADDTFVDREGILSYDGAEGSDTIDLSGRSREVFLSLSSEANEGETDSDETAAVQTGLISAEGGEPAPSEGNLPAKRLVSIENVIGTGFNDNLTGSAQDNRIEAGDGDDFVDGGAGGRDVLIGGNGIDTVAFDLAQSSIVFDLGKQGELQSTDIGQILAEGFESTIGSAFSDTLSGDNNDNTLIGNDGNDMLEGGAGNDTLIGAGNDDILGGGEGTDTFLYQTFGGLVLEGNDTITDFNLSEDILDMRASFETIEAVRSATSQQGSNALISLGESGSVLIQNVNAEDLLASPSLLVEASASA